MGKDGWRRIVGFLTQGRRWGKGVEAAEEREGVSNDQASNVDELAKLELVRADEVGVYIGDGDKDGGDVEGGGELEEVATAVEVGVQREDGGLGATKDEGGTAVGEVEDTLNGGSDLRQRKCGELWAEMRMQICDYVRVVG
ncbi:hypothetical protein Fmac_026307 [Flemingia macrophylla]|uniref:Uncharacterized protein n=1 Tax=Flemingia macrophylla TaxID=520843 RepID=A0ABD1LEH8_9FABA